MLNQTSTYTKKCRLKARTWTHLHIGCGRDVGRWEYYFTEDGKQLAFLDYDKLSIEALSNESLMDKLTEAAALDPSGSLQKFLQSPPIVKDDKLKERISSSFGLRTLPASMIAVAPELRSMRKLRLFVGSPHCYIPGSSIKGALRSAYLYKQIANSKNKSEFLPRDASADDFANLRILRERLQGTFRPQSEQTRLFENIIVRDGVFIDHENMGIASIGLFGSGKKTTRINEKSRQGKDSDEYAEVLLADSEFQLELSLRRSRKYTLALSDLHELFQIADEFYRRVWQEEHLNQQKLAAQNKGIKDTFDFYENTANQVPSDYYLLRVGYGAGQMANSILLNYRDQFQEQYADSADSPLRHSLLYRKQPQLKQRQPYPFTARSALAGNRQNWIPLGWIAVSKEELAEIEN